jgi:hypothetical protein
VSDDSKNFWVVWQPENRAPTMRHLTRGDADKEAERLALANPGKRFYVLKALAFVERNDVRRVTLGDAVSPW